ncbi:MAG TPA: tryptophan synthase subunit alpha [Gammaproteobacteria bacterium]|nr:tryptophan synthase subunit alpha [Gammaproteobacteria bacterium]
MSNRLKRCFSDMAKSSRCALITYVTAGDPEPDATLSIMRSLAASGADVIELGMPFSDPMADGPIIQRASERALKSGTTLISVLDTVQKFREEDLTIPVVLMGYLNPIEAMGYANFVEKAAAVGVDGVLIVDVPPEEADEINTQLVTGGLDQIFLVAPNSSLERIENVCKFASGFVYYVSVKGVTGGKSVDAEEVGAHIQQFRQRLSLPIGVGFGIKSPESAGAIAGAGDAVIVGSAIVEIIEEHRLDLAVMQQRIESFVTQLRLALDSARMV